MVQITNEHLQFMAEAKLSFSDNAIQETFRNEKEYPGMIALRMGWDRDCIEVHEIGDRVANFVQMLDPQPYPEKKAMEFVLHAALLNKEKEFTYSFDQGLVGSILEAAFQLKKEVLNGGPANQQEILELTAYILAVTASLGARMLNENED